MVLFQSGLGTAFSGSFAGLNFAHGPGGQYFRAKAFGVNPATPLQTTLRAWFRFFADQWSNFLTEDQREGWRVYAGNTPLAGPLGNLRPISARAMYIRTSIPRAIARLAQPEVAPTIFGVAAFTPVTSQKADVATQELNIFFNKSDPWANETASAMLVFISRPQNAARTFFDGPYRFADTIAGSPTEPPDTPADIKLPFQISDGQRVFWRVSVSLADGRYSQTQRGSVPAT